MPMKIQLFLLTAFISVCLGAGGQDQFQIGSPKTWPHGKVEAWYAHQAQIALLGERPPRRRAIISGNRIRTIIWDHGSIGQPAAEPSLEWPTFSTHGYGYEFGPFVGVEVPVDTNGHFLPYFDENGQPIAHDKSNPAWRTTHHIISDGLRDGGAAGISEELSPDGEYWTWEPVEGYGSDESESIPLSNKPDTWPARWQQEWPGTYQVGASSADQAAYYVMDDRYNLEYTTNPPGGVSFYPFPDDPTVGGMGLRVEVRIYQWANPLARDAIFFVYEITNTSDNDYEKVLFGMFGDPHIGGSNDYTDDYAYFDKQINMVFGYDGDDKGDWGGLTGWLGYMFLESPGNQYDGIDNDDDGMIDESMTNGIDDDGDWDPIKDDVGVDGIGPDNPFYLGPDEGEGDGQPTAGDRYDPLRPGEPNFDGTDLDEADQIGLTSFNAYRYGTEAIKMDENIWRRTRPVGVVDSAAAFTEIIQNADNVFLYGSGYFPLKARDTQRFSIALLMGRDAEDLFATAKIVQRIYNSGYRFAKAPDIPLVSAVPGDRQVTLYWDDRAEASWDPTFGYDFEGYSVYRATDPGFTEVYTITDNSGNPKLFEPLARFDLINGITGESKVGIRGLHFDLGDDTGLKHEYVDDDVLNGTTYYYAVVSYDAGDTTGRLEIPPTECAMTIMEEELTGVLVPDPNVKIVVPTASVPGMDPPEVISQEHEGPGTGTVLSEILDPAAVRENAVYTITFGDPYVGGPDTVMYVTDETVLDTVFTVQNTDWVRVSPVHKHVTRLEVEYGTAGGVVPDSLYTYNPIAGTIRFESELVGSNLLMTYNPQPVFQSSYMANEDANQVFDGIRLYVQDEIVRLNLAETGWLNSNTNYNHIVGIWPGDPPGHAYPHSYEIVWQDTIVLSMVSQQKSPFIIYDITYPESLTTVAWYYQGLAPTDTFNIDRHKIGILEVPELDPVYMTWQVDFNAPVNADPIPPQGGDIFRIRLDKPFSSDDVFTLTTKSASYNPETTENTLDQIRVVPNPYVAVSIYEPPSGFAAGRGDRQVQFINLPPECTIKIFTIAGELVRTIEHKGSLWESRESYDLLNKENMEIAFGMYIWHVDARELGLGEKIGKFAVIK